LRRLRPSRCSAWIRFSARQREDIAKAKDDRQGEG
jgi:hypothetical protein